MAQFSLYAWQLEKDFPLFPPCDIGFAEQKTEGSAINPLEIDWRPSSISDEKREVPNIRSGDTKAGQSMNMQRARKCKHEGKGEVSTVCIMLMASSEARLKRSRLAKSVVFRISARIWCDMLISQGEPANGHH